MFKLDSSRNYSFGLSGICLNDDGILVFTVICPSRLHFSHSRFGGEPCSQTQLDPAYPKGSNLWEAVHEIKKNSESSQYATLLLQCIAAFAS
ncbi:hypothetical protein AVEN_61433-1 [Araneus ventricosus]|uniref:Uncharacterized protein n=1 Tax=Araneus ventricosus TaxID=182803 RepID=A0A4Y2MAR1_ARAVE|nr:hypothetical protein AVEN_61433-1 [Araneus ventricosus]